MSVPKGSTAFWTDLLSNFWKISRLLGKIKNTVSLRFISLSFPRKKIILWRTCPYWQWIVCTMKKGNDRYLWSTGKNYNYFPKGKFKSFNSFFHKVCLVFSIRLISIAHLFALRCLWDVFNRIKCCAAWHIARQTFWSRRLACLLGLFTFARIGCLLQLWIKTSDLDYLIWATPK